MSTETDIRVAEALETCAEKWESGQWGWTKRRFDRSDLFAGEGVAYCAVGGLRKAITGTVMLPRAESDSELINMAHTALIYKGRIASFDLAYWNDFRCRTKSEVIELFKNTAKDIRNAQGEGNGSQGH